MVRLIAGDGDALNRLAAKSSRNRYLRPMFALRTMTGMGMVYFRKVSMSRKQAAASSGEVEITPEMVEAGVRVLRASVHEEPHHDFHEVVREIFCAMKGAGSDVGAKATSRSVCRQAD